MILRNLLKAIPKIRNVIPAAEELEKLFSKYQEGVVEINKNPDLELLKDFQQESESNFLLEYDEVSDFISSQLDELTKSKKEGEDKLKKVLVIDDLDRLDPEHIFRLFNVFSAHFDQVHYFEDSGGNDNKFGFDKIIFVCDIENIRKIFAHKYGEQVDFSGYIDKFYSTEIYGGNEIFLLKLKKAANTYSNNIQFDLNYRYGPLIEDIVLFADIENHKFNYNKVQEANPNKIEFHTSKGHLFSYKVYGGYFSNYYEEGEMWFRSEIERAFELKISNGNFHAILVSAVENVIKYGLI